MSRQDDESAGELTGISRNRLRWAWTVGAISASLDLWALRGLLVDEVAQALWLHGVAVLLAAVTGFLSTAQRNWRSPVCCALLATALPTVGSLIVATSLVGLLRQRSPRQGPKLMRIELPSHRHHPSARSISVNHFKSAFRDTHGDPLLEVGSLRPMAPRYSVPVLKQHLDGDREDVRLLAYALIERHERGLRRKIESLLVTSEDGAPPEMHPHRARELAQLYWELVQGELVSEGAREQVLGDASRWARKAIDQSQNDGPTWLLLAKIELAAKRPDAAARCLVRARLCGVSAGAAAAVQSDIREQERGPNALPSAARSNLPLPANDQVGKGGPTS